MNMLLKLGFIGIAILGLMSTVLYMKYSHEENRPFNFVFSGVLLFTWVCLIIGAMLYP